MASKRPKSTPPIAPAAAAAIPALATEFHTVLASWVAARDLLRQAGAAAAAAQAALEVLTDDATEAQKHDAQELRSETLSRAEEAIGVVIALPDFPAIPAAEAVASAVDITATPGEPIVLTVDTDKPRGALQAVKVTGPKAGRYRLGHHFTDAVQRLLVSQETYGAIKADPALMVAFDD